MKDYRQEKAFLEQVIARKRARRREIARLPIGEKFRMLEELHETSRDFAAIRASAKAAQKK